MVIRLIAKPISEQIRAEVKDQSSHFFKLHARKPKLVVILVGSDPASILYTGKKGEAASSVGMDHETLQFPSHISPRELRAEIESLNQDSEVDGILLQRPLPPQLTESEVVYWIAPGKDVDAFHPVHVGRLSLKLPSLKPCTPSGIMALLEYYHVEVSGKIACVIGRSALVGKPIAQLLLNHDATVIQCHSKTSQLKELTLLADILIVATGKKEMINDSYIKDQAVVIDVGIHPDSLTGKVTGDVEITSAVRRASKISPVPGGVGPMTITLLLKNTLQAAVERQALEGDT